MSRGPDLWPDGSPPAGTGWQGPRESSTGHASLQRDMSGSVPYLLGFHPSGMVEAENVDSYKTLYSN